MSTSAPTVDAHNLPNVGDTVLVTIGPQLVWHIHILHVSTDGRSGYDKFRYAQGDVLPAIVLRRALSLGPTALLLEVLGLPEGRRFHVLHGSSSGEPDTWTFTKT